VDKKKEEEEPKGKGFQVYEFAKYNVQV